MRWWSAAFALTTGACILAAWPLALNPPPFTLHGYYIRLPVYAVLSGLAVVGITTRWLALPKWLIGCLAAYGLLLLAQFAVPGWRLLSIVEAACFPLLALGIAYLDDRDEGKIAAALALCWCLQVGYGTLAVVTEETVIGTCGNRNWFATCVLATAPWAGYMLRTLPRGLRWSGWCVISCGSLMMLRLADSRAALLALLAALGALALGKLPLRARWGAGTMVVIVALAAGTQLVPKLAKQDMRPALWQTAAHMVADHPLLGVGVGRYELHAPQQTLKTDYQLRYDAADVTRHPHNETLNIAATRGIPAAVLWLILCVSVVACIADPNPIRKLAFVSCVALLVHGQLDRIQAIAPTDLIAFTCIGLCWRRFANSAKPQALAWVEDYRLLSTCLGLCLLASVGLLSHRVLSTGTATLRAKLYQKSGQAHEAIREFRSAFAEDPTNHNLLYEGGALAMQQRDPDLAMPLLLQCERLAPDFAHLQRYLGLAFMMSGDPLSARPHYQRETELYPWMLSGWQERYWNAHACGETAELHDVSERLRELYAYRGKFWWPDRKKSLELWAVALNSGDAKAAAQAMRDWPPLHQKARPERFADPALGRLLSDLRPSTELAHGGFHEIDAEWWLALLARARNIRSTDTTNDLHQLLAQCTVTEQDTRAPDQMVNGAGPAESCAVFAIWMLADAPPLLVAGDGWLGWLREDHMLVIEHGGAGWDVRPESAEFAPEFPANLLLLPQSFFLRNLLLFTIQKARAPTLFPTPFAGELEPGKAWLETEQSWQSERPFEGVYLPPFEALLTR
ncbi:MAG TPA: hypothetical protein DCR55_08720 [Lentisphaeria bacterium]|jgi:tetratricopeptide (TPR) repeat protein|nr:hypothetical protein [Lentisphaeria bacterium]